jgi:hypothetical protein
LVEDLFKYFGVLKLLADLGNDGVSQFPLLSSLDLAFITDPRVEDNLCFGGNVGLLF